MERIIRVNLHSLRNEEWFQLFTAFKNLVEKYTAAGLDITNLFVKFLVVYAQADEALEIIRKSLETSKMDVADAKRDNTFRGFVNAVKSAINHYNVEKREAAQAVMIVIDHYGNLARRAPDEETAGLYNLIQDMRNKYAPQMTTLELEEWVDELDGDNKAYEALVDLRNEEIVSRCKYRMLAVRREADNVYHRIVERLEALMLLNTDPIRDAFVNEFNGYLKQRKDIVAQRKGISKHKKENKNEE